MNDRKIVNVESTLVEKLSKQGKTYYVIEVAITPNYKKIVFLDNAELELIRSLYL